MLILEKKIYILQIPTPGLKAGSPSPTPIVALLGFTRVVVNVPMVTNSDWLIIILMDAMKRVDWF